ncbi:hypothetical protein [Paraburkholderia pallida]|uniref:Uncharacterized protein n=1 Tax=Paraburkholderia pallida TaxID=2547399 RepID=A0A4P7CQQ5_9BURK|nr:hypothetical protein [Paraburkholderia pallida]QBQ96299.1 hypothetical protein E1956_03335 [Paraburkholderia pallida]
MNRLETNLRAAQGRLESLRSALAQDLNVAEDAFDAIKRIASDAPSRSIAELGRFYLEWLTNELNDKTAELQDLLEAAIKDAGEISQ